MAEFPNTAFVIFSTGAFGGAEKRFLNLSSYLHRENPGAIRLFVNPLMESHIRRIFPDSSFDYLDVIGNTGKTPEIPTVSEAPVSYNDHSPDPMAIDTRTSGARKYYWYYKNKFRQKRLFRNIEALVKK